jgi:hypothetical protein
MHLCTHLISLSFQDIDLYNSVLNAWQLCEQNDDVTVTTSPPEKAERILDSLCKHHEAEKSHLSPSDASFSMCIQTWCKSPKNFAAERAERLLRLKEEYLHQVEGLVIRVSDYNPVILKWKDDHENGPDRATSLFEDMMEKSILHEAYQYPNVSTLNILLAVLSKSNDKNGAEKAEALLRRMDKLYEEKRLRARTDMISYRTVINAFIARKEITAPAKVEALVDDMIYLYKTQGRKELRPDPDLLDSILKACNLAPMTWNIKDKANSHNIIEIANRTFTKLIRGGKNEFQFQATHSTYAFMLRILHRHMNFNDPRYDLLMANIWAQCCRDGLVSEFTLESLRLSVRRPLFFDLVDVSSEYGSMDAESIKVSNLDQNWRRNVKAKRSSNGS